MSILLELAVKSVGLLTLVAIVAGLMRRTTAALRHRMWALAFVGLAALPLLALRVPEIRIERPATPYRHLTSFSAPRSAALPKATTAQQPTPALPPETESKSQLPGLLVAMWGLGVFLLLGRTAFQLLIAARLTKGGEDVPAGLPANVPPHTRVLRTPLVDVPVTIGFLRPTILLPSDSTAWPEERLRAVLLHEGAHIQRGDWAWIVSAKVVGAFYWPNPLVLLAESRLRVEGELAADDAVLLAGFDAPNYAATLVDLAEGLRNRSLGAALPFVEAGSLKARIAAILRGATSRGPLQRSAAFIALVLGAIVLIPYAAARFVAGPEVIRESLIDLGDGRRIEIIAITEMRGQKSVSWDTHGALLNRPFPISDADLQWFKMLKPVPPGAAVRYVIFRMEGAESDSQTFYSASDDTFEDHTYMGTTFDDGMNFVDALGGTYRVLRLVGNPGASTASLQVKLPASDWKLFAYQNYSKGDMRESLNPNAELHIAPMMPSHGAGTEATFVLPPEFKNRESMVRFLPGDATGPRYECLSGSQTATTTMPPESVTRVEVLSRPLRTVVLAGLPLAPDPKAVYVPHHFFPEVSVIAERGKAQLPDGSTMGLRGVCRIDSPDKGWDIEGNPVGEIMPREAKLERDTSKEKAAGDHPKALLWMSRRPSGSPDPQILYDGEGWPLFRSFLGLVYPPVEYRGFSSDINNSVHRVDVVAPVPVGHLRLLARIESDHTTNTQWRFAEKKGWTGSLHVEYPMVIADQMAGLDSEIVALDANGKVVTRPDGAQGSETGPGWVEFDLPRAAAANVTTVEIRTRPYAWVKYPNVPLAPKSPN